MTAANEGGTGTLQGPSGVGPIQSVKVSFLPQWLLPSPFCLAALQAGYHFLGIVFSSSVFPKPKGFLLQPAGNPPFCFTLPPYPEYLKAQ